MLSNFLCDCRKRLEEEQRQRQLAEEARKREAEKKRQAELLELQRRREEDVQRQREMELRQREGVSRCVCVCVLIFDIVCVGGDNNIIRQSFEHLPLQHK